MYTGQRNPKTAAWPNGAWAGIGFALPVDRVNDVVTKIINDAGGRAP